MKWLANASKSDAATITKIWTELKIGEPVPKKLEELELVGIYGDYPGSDKS